MSDSSLTVEAFDISIETIVEKHGKHGNQKLILFI